MAALELAERKLIIVNINLTEKDIAFLSFKQD
jgi:hypothetical protein